MKDITNHHDKMFQELPKWIADKGVEFIKKEFPQEVVVEIKEMYKKDPDTWWALYHHGWGTGVRNHLRDNVCLDDELPSKNWDDYYIRIVEIACGLYG